MPLAVTQNQQVTLAHRENFVGRPTGAGSVAWDYKGETHQVNRPDDGQPARSWQVKCKECGQQLEFTVHSVRAARRRQGRLRACAWAGLAVLVASVIGFVLLGGDALPFLIPAAIAGAAVGYYAGVIAAAEMGITGHGAGKPIVAKHAVAVLEARPDDRPELVCGTCGHQEEFPWGSHYRKSWVDKQYEAAKERMDAHTCRGVDANG